MLRLPLDFLRWSFALQNLTTCPESRQTKQSLFSLKVCFQMLVLAIFKYFDTPWFAKLQNGHVFFDAWVDFAEAE